MPRQISRYIVKKVLGRGGFGIVYLASDEKLQRLVAIKLPHPQLVTRPEDAEPYLAEARTVAALDHPNIVQAYTLEEADGLHLLVMEYVEGVTLHQHIQQHGPLEPWRAADYIGQAAGGLANIHQAGLVHRDLKPRNLMLDRRGTVKVLDLGLARFCQGPRDDLTQRLNKDAVLGTAD